MKKSLLSLGCVAALAAFTACSEDSEALFGSSDAQQSSKVTFSVEKLFDSQTRTILHENGLSAWTAGDQIGVIPCLTADGSTPASQDQVKFLLSQSSIKSDGSCVFDGGSWALREGWSYIAYYPFTMENYYHEGSIRISYSSIPAQNGDGTIGHLASVDYLGSSAVTVKGGNVNFEMQHLLAFVPLKLTFPEDVEVLSVTAHLKNYVGYDIKNGQFVYQSSGFTNPDVITMPVNKGATTNGTFTANLFVAPQTTGSGYYVSVLTNKGEYKTEIPADLTLKAGANTPIACDFAKLPSSFPEVKSGETLTLAEGSGQFVLNIEESGLYRFDFENLDDVESFINQFEYVSNNFYKVEAGTYLFSYATLGAPGSFAVVSAPPVELGTQDVLPNSYYSFCPTSTGIYTINVVGWETQGHFLGQDGYGISRTHDMYFSLQANKTYLVWTFDNSSELTIAKAEMTPISLNETVSVPLSSAQSEEYYTFFPSESGWYEVWDSASGSANIINPDKNAAGLDYMSAGKAYMVRANNGISFKIKSSESPMYVSVNEMLKLPGHYVITLPSTESWYYLEDFGVSYKTGGGNNFCAAGKFYYAFNGYKGDSEVHIIINDFYEEGTYLRMAHSNPLCLNVAPNDSFSVEKDSYKLVALTITTPGSYIIGNNDVEVFGGTGIDNNGYGTNFYISGNKAVFYKPGTYYLVYYPKPNDGAVVSIIPE